jgi:acyl transferase domain-containing protein
VRFHDAIRMVIESGCSAIVEVGPHPALTPAIGGAVGAIDTRMIHTLDRDGEDVRNMLRTAGELFVAGASIDPARLFEGTRNRRIPAPLYPFRRDRYWFSADGPGTIVAQAPTPHPTVVEPTAPAPDDAAQLRYDAAQLRYEETLTTTTPWVDHRILGKTVFPGSGYLELAVRACATVDGGEPRPITPRPVMLRPVMLRPVVLRDVSFLRPLVLTPGKSVGVGVLVDKAREGGAGFVVSGRGGGDVYCRGVFEPGDAAGEPVALDDLRATISTGLAPGRFYGQLRQAGLEYGASFSTVRELWTGGQGRGEALGRITVTPDGAPSEDHGFRLSTMLDGCIQLTAAALGTLSEQVPEGAYLPYRLHRLTLTGHVPAQVWTHVRVELNETGSAAVATLRVADDDGKLLVELAGLELRYAQSLTIDGSGGTPAGTPRRGGDARAELVARLTPLSRDKRLAVVTEWVIDEVRDTLGRLAAENEHELDAASINPSVALLELGLDSLMITEFQRRIQERLDFRFAAMETVEYQGIADLAQYILDRVLALAPTNVD